MNHSAINTRTDDFLLEIPNDTKLLHTVGTLNELSKGLEDQPEYQQAISEAVSIIDLISRYREQVENSRQ